MNCGSARAQVSVALETWILPAGNALQAVQFQAVQADSPPPPPLLAEAQFAEQSCLMIKNQI